MARSKLPKQSQAGDTRLSNAADVTVSAFHETLPLYASATLGLQGWTTRIFDANTGQPRITHELPKSQTCLCLAWGSHPNTTNAQAARRKKRKADGPLEGVSNAGDMPCLAAGMSDGSIVLLPGAQEAQIGTLVGQHTSGVTGLTFERDCIWSVAADGKVVRWEFGSSDPTSFSLSPDPNLTSICVPTSATVLVGSYKIYQVDRKGQRRQEYTNHASPVHRLITADFGRSFVSAAEGDRYVNVFSLSEKSKIRTLVAEAAVREIACSQSAVAALTADNTVELFGDVFAAADEDTSADKHRKTQKTFTSQGRVRILRPPVASEPTAKSQAVELNDVRLRDGMLTIAWTEGARVVFESVDLRSAQGLDLSSRDIERAMLPMLGHTKAGATAAVAKQLYQDGHAVIASGESTGDLETEPVAGLPETRPTNGNNLGSQQSEPTMAERLKMLELSSRSVAERRIATSQMSMPAANSLTTVLTQSLRSNDVALLESCFEHQDSAVILESVKHLDPTLALTLLEQLAIRLSKKPNRAGELGTWIRWTVVVHGGYLSSLPHLVKSLTMLNGVLSTRSQQLPRLLTLQGRLDMLQAQIDLRKQSSRTVRRQVLAEPHDVDYNEADSDEDAMAEDMASDESDGDFDDDDDDNDDYAASQESETGGVKDVSGANESDAASETDGEFSADDDDGGKFAKLDAQMELGRSSASEDDDDDEEASDDGGGR